MKAVISILFAAAMLLACTKEPAEAPAPAADTGIEAGDSESLDPAKGIDWFEGSVDEAFAKAKETGKPVYLYWGAVWCPPCHAISATVFKSPDFLERSKLFVPVYLDGDTENAQAMGERFGVRGYPTMIVFDSSGQELTRIPGGIDLQAYANILDLTLSQASSATGLVESLAAGQETLSPDDCSLLAYYSWPQDLSILADKDAGQAFRSMYQACPETSTVERSILYFAWLDEAVSAAIAEENPVALTEEQKSEALQRIDAVLESDELVRANIFSVILSGADYVKTLTEPGSDERNALMARLEETYDRIAADESIYKRERIYSLAGKIALERLKDPEAELSAELRHEVREMVVWADETTPSVWERQPIINALGNVLEEAGMDDVAKPLLLAELDRSRQPYYFMVAIADIEQRAGNNEAAVEWLRQAYESTTGPATRFQWGYYYLTGLLEMMPENTELIRSVTVELIDELQNSGGLYHRSKAQLAGLEESLLAWSEKNNHAAELQDIRNSVMTICETASQQGESRATCDAFLEQA